jgi:large-conductance mechanosensitive channel
MNIFEFMDRNPLLSLLLAIAAGAAFWATVTDVVRTIVAGFMR